jgi:hypothetical protein
MFKGCNSYSELLISTQHFLVRDFSFYFRISYVPAKFTKFATLHPLCGQKSAKIPNEFKGSKKNTKLLLFLGEILSFFCVEHSFERQDYSF